MEISFDSTKDARNLRERGLSFERVAEVDFNTALVFPDTRKEYGEIRYIALCYLDSSAACVVFHRDRDGYPGDQFPQGKRERGEKTWQTANH